MTEQNRHKFFYGWIVALGCSMLAFSINAMGNNSLSFYVTPLAESFDTSRTVLNFCVFTMSALSRTALGFFYGWLSRRVGVKRLMWIGCAFAVAAYVLYASASAVYMIAIGSAFYGVAHAVGTFSAYNLIINKWFIEKKGLVLGLVNVSVGLGGMVINPLASHWIENSGWQNSFLYTAVLIAAIAIPALCVVRTDPEAMGLKAYGTRESAAQGQTEKGESIGLGRAMGTLRFWLIAFMQFILGFAITQGLTNLVAHFNELGMDADFMNNVVSVVLALGIAVGAVSSGLVYDRFGLRAMFLSIGGIQLFGLISAAFIRSEGPAVIAAACAFCVGYGNSMMLGTLAHLINAVFGRGKTQFGAVFSCLFAICNGGTILGSPVIGKLFDITGSYRVSYIMGAGCLVVFLIMANVLIAMGKRLSANGPD